jgi:hypothetical protein
MKSIKFIALTLLFFACQNVEVSTKKAEAQYSRAYTEAQYSREHGYYMVKDEVISGMTYRIFSIPWESGYTGYFVHTINLTKDSLECKLLRNQIYNFK